MVRTIVQVTQVRMRDVHPGDVINKNHDDPRGWFVVTDVQELHTGQYAIIADSDKNSINGGPFDMVGVQIAKQVEIPVSAA